MVKKVLARNVEILILIVIFLFMSVSLFNYDNLWWDSGVYEGTARYISSGGEYGIIEPSRPLVLPLILSFFSFLGLDLIFWGKSVMVLFSVGSVFMTYLIGRDIFDKRTGIIAASFVCFSATFLFFSSMVLSGIPSMFFMLVCFYFFFKKRYFLAGIFGGLSFFTRFLELFGFMVILGFVFVESFKKKDFSGFLKLILGFFALGLPFFVFYQFYFGNFLFPFLEQVFLTRETGWMYYEPWFFYFKILFFENSFFVFAFSFLFFGMKIRDNSKRALALIFVLFFIFFSLTAHKESRFILVFIPYLCILASRGIFIFLDRLKSKKTAVFLAVFFVLFFSFQSGLNFKSAYESSLQSKGLDEIKENLFLPRGSNIWISNPIYSLFFERRVSGLIYYPTFDKKRYLEVNESLFFSDIIIFSECDIPCPPSYDECEKDKEKLIYNLNNNFNKKIISEKNKECAVFMFYK